MNNISPCDITNIKELKLFTDFPLNNIPQEVFVCVCDSIIDLMKSPKLSLNTLRDTIYDILIYNIDATECLWYILSHFIENKLINEHGTKVRSFNDDVWDSFGKYTYLYVFAFPSHQNGVSFFCNNGKM